MIAKRDLVEARVRIATLERSVASSTEALEDTGRRLSESNEEGDLLKIEIDQVRSGSSRDWFFAGAGVLLAGILVGLIAPRLRRRRRSSW